MDIISNRKFFTMDIISMPLFDIYKYTYNSEYKWDSSTVFQGFNLLIQTLIDVWPKKDDYTELVVVSGSSYSPMCLISVEHWKSTLSKMLRRVIIDSFTVNVKQCFQCVCNNVHVLHWEFCRVVPPWFCCKC